MATANGHMVEVKTRHRVVDIKLLPDAIRLTVNIPDGERNDYVFDHVVMATGHDWPDTTEIKPGFFMSPWPATALKTIGACAVGILGTSLSAIDALITVSTAHGAFYLDPAGQLQYQASAEGDAFQASMMSRKGLHRRSRSGCGLSSEIRRQFVQQALLRSNIVPPAQVAFRARHHQRPRDRTDRVQGDSPGC